MGVDVLTNGPEEVLQEFALDIMHGKCTSYRGILKFSEWAQESELWVKTYLEEV